MIIKNVKVFTEDKAFIDGQIAIQDGVFVTGWQETDEVIDGEGCYAIDVYKRQVSTLGEQRSSMDSSMKRGRF